MNATRVADVWPMPDDPLKAEPQLAELLKHARERGQRVSIAGTRHSMGGQTIHPGGIVIDMLTYHEMKLDEDHAILHVQAGATWKQVIAFLDARGYSVSVMQSDNTFSVGGSISVNCHGWQYNRPPIASTVESFRLMKADGTIAHCSRQENTELFSLVLGGYGLFGIILEADLRVVPNERYRLEQRVMPTGKVLAAIGKDLKSQPDVMMVYGRLGIVPERFFDDAILNVLHRDPSPDGKVPKLSAPGMASIRRTLFRGSAESDYGKRLRWAAEAKLQPSMSHAHVSRNQLLNEGSEIFANYSARSTDILHEYFLPPDGAEHFLTKLRKIIPRHQGDLLNVTVRYVDTDSDSYLRYADQPILTFVMLFTQPTTSAGDARMQVMTQEIIDAALAAGGRYYLPYRLHATQDQFERAYPNAAEFFALKRKYDPDELFQNRLYTTYSSGRPKK